jgi:hypothetical protein
MGAGGLKKVDEALADWRQAERALDAAASEREAAEEKAGTLERIEDSVAQSAADAEATARAAQQAQRSANAAMTAVAEVSESARDDLARAVAAEQSAQDAHAAARAEHRVAQEEAMRRYRTAEAPRSDGPDARGPDPGTRPDEVSGSGPAL